MKSFMTLAFASTVILSGCAEFNTRSLESTTPTGSEFNKALTSEYKTFARSETDQFDDYDGDYFARKGLATAEGRNMLPDLVSQRRVPEGSVKELNDARSRLMGVFDRGGRSVDPKLAARAQERFDCWLEQQEENHQPDDILACKTDFMKAIGELEGKFHNHGNVPPAHVVLFKFDSDKIDSDGIKEIEKAVMDVKGGTQKSFTIHVMGHTDKIGKASHNMDLSKKRAAAVKAELIKRGVTESDIHTMGKGEMPGKYVEPDNRRVDILWY